MRLVLDSNEYIAGFGDRPDLPPARLLDYFLDHPGQHEIVASRTIVEEVRRNLLPEAFKDFWSFLAVFAVNPVEDWEIPSALHAKYQAMGLKGGDAAIAACAEAASAVAVITENRDFHGRSGLPFRPLRAEEFLKEQGTASHGR
ncbi:MAG: PIN domain-containing protein [Candidatus Coatesbacteria bacterium]